MTGEELPPLPLGAPVDPREAQRPPRLPMVGKRIALRPLEPQHDLDGLFAAAQGSPEKDRLWTYMAVGPFRTRDELQAYLDSCARLDDPLAFTVVDRAGDRPIGMASFMNIDPQARRLELGSIWYEPAYQRGRANPEAMLLMLRRSFDELGYRRVEWKCDALNDRSRRAALRLGFRFEGLFRQHMIIKDRNRDTAWYSMLDEEWLRVRGKLEEAVKEG